MEAWLQSSIHALLGLLALPEIGLPAIFIVSLVSATLLPLGSEPAVFAYTQSVPHMFWPAVLVATAGNTAGGAIGYAMGVGAQAAWHRWQVQHASHGPGPGPVPSPQGRWHALSTRWFQRFGPPTLLLSWLPFIGDPLCVAAGWLRLPFWACIAYMAIGKCVRYIVMTTALLHAWPLLNTWL
jgi:membrane protein YqaA with SNARE-associated domain